MSLSKKKAVSLIVSYVILIVIGMSLSVLVYRWLSFRTIFEEGEKCPEGISLVIKDYDCSIPYQFNVTIQNKGTFSVDGFVIRASTDPNANVGILPLPSDSTTTPKGMNLNYVSPGGEVKLSLKNQAINWLRFIEIQPFIKKTQGSETRYIFCEQVLKQKLNCPS